MVRCARRVVGYRLCFGIYRLACGYARDIAAMQVCWVRSTQVERYTMFQSRSLAWALEIIYVADILEETNATGSKIIKGNMQNQMSVGNIVISWVFEVDLMRFGVMDFRKFFGWPWIGEAISVLKYSYFVSSRFEINGCASEEEEYIGTGYSV